jgi:hypothetical protein
MGFRVRLINFHWARACWLILLFHIFSSGDSTGSTPAQSEAAYDTRIGQKPNTILALNHEVKGKFVFNALKFQSDHTFLQNPLREHLIP